MKPSQRGYSLIELSIALAIVAVVIAGSIVGVQAILRSNNVNQTITQTNQAVGKIISKMVRDPSYAGATTAALAAANMNVWPDSSITRPAGGGAPSVVHSFGNSVFVAPLAAAAHGVAANQGLVYTLTGIPVAACAGLVLGLDGLATAVGITNQAPIAAAPTAIGATLVKDVGVNMTATTVNTACSGASSTATIRILIPRS